VKSVDCNESIVNDMDLGEITYLTSHLICEDALKANNMGLQIMEKGKQLFL